MLRTVKQLRKNISWCLCLQSKQRNKSHGVGFIQLQASVCVGYTSTLKMTVYIINGSMKVDACTDNAVYHKLRLKHLLKYCQYASQCHSYPSCSRGGCLPAQVTLCQLAVLSGSAHFSSSTPHWQLCLSHPAGEKTNSQDCLCGWFATVAARFKEHEYVILTVILLCKLITNKLYVAVLQQHSAQPDFGFWLYLSSPTLLSKVTPKAKSESSCVPVVQVSLMLSGNWPHAHSKACRPIKRSMGVKYLA